MPIAAIPRYLGDHFEEASPALRFGMLLPFWTAREDQEKYIQERAAGKSREAGDYKESLQQGMDVAIAQWTAQKKLPGLWRKTTAFSPAAWKKIRALNASDIERMKALAQRQEILAQTRRDILRFDGISSAPFTTGLGNEHPLENGFAFLNPYGLPYLPGSGIKGVLRQSVRELARGEWGDTQGWSDEKVYTITVGKETVQLSIIDALFGLESGDGDTLHVRGALSFWDVIPQIRGHELLVEIMTPHQSHYYQQSSDRRAGESMSPHDSGLPNPITFLTVPPRSDFTFWMDCDTTRLQAIAPDLVQNGCWREVMQTALAHAFEWLGFGAKTAVGYGAMNRNVEMETRLAQKRQDAEKAALRAQMTPARQSIESFVEYMQARHTALLGKPTKIGAEYNSAKDLAETARNDASWTPEEKRDAAAAISEWLPKVVQVDIKEQRKKLKLSQIAPD
ncbi:MAG: type III-B CRISPR module RAMP protein Cmr6 [Acidithiobacillus sp.]